MVCTPVNKDGMVPGYFFLGSHLTRFVFYFDY